MTAFAPNRKVVVDAGAAIKLQRLERFGKEFFTTSGVLAEIRDRQARMHLQTLPFEIKVKDPIASDIAFVKHFASLTGDVGFLSPNDIALIALTYRLHLESPDAAKVELRSKPVHCQLSEERAPLFAWGPETLVAAKQQEESPSDASAARAACRRSSKDLLDLVYTSCLTPSSSEATAPTAVVTKGGNADEAAREKEKEKKEQQESENEQAEDEEDDSSDGEWITTDNLHRYHASLGEEEQLPGADVHLACITADYSVQNVLLQIGLRVLSFEGYMIRSVKLWGLICRACFHISRDTTKVFCPKCGHSTVDRVPITVEADGSVNVHDNRRRRNLKGTIYSIPKNRGGRQRGPLYAADEVLIGGMDREMRRSAKLQEKERMMSDPFNVDNGARGWYQRDLNGRGNNSLRTGPARLTAGYGRRNPNSNNFNPRTGNKKKGGH